MLASLNEDEKYTFKIRVINTSFTYTNLLYLVKISFDRKDLVSIRSGQMMK